MLDSHLHDQPNGKYSKSFELMAHQSTEQLYIPLLILAQSFLSCTLAHICLEAQDQVLGSLFFHSIFIFIIIFQHNLAHQ